MNPNLIRNLFICARGIVFNNPPLNRNRPIVSLAASGYQKFRHYSNELTAPSTWRPGPSSDEDASSDSDVEEVTEEELKKRIQKFYDGDEDAIPSILEGILKRKMAGKNDDQIIEQLPCRADRGTEVFESDEEDED